MAADPTGGSPIGHIAYLLGMEGGLHSSDALSSFCSPMWAPGGSCRLDRPPPILHTEAADRRRRAPTEIATPIRSMQRNTRREAAGHPKRVEDPLLVWGRRGGDSSKKQ